MNIVGGDPQAPFKKVRFSDLTDESSISRHPFAERPQVSVRPPESWWRFLGGRRMKALQNEVFDLFQHYKCWHVFKIFPGEV